MLHGPRTLRRRAQQKMRLLLPRDHLRRQLHEPLRFDLPNLPELLRRPTHQKLRTMVFLGLLFGDDAEDVCYRVYGHDVCG